MANRLVIAAQVDRTYQSDREDGIDLNPVPFELETPEVGKMAFLSFDQGKMRPTVSWGRGLKGIKVEPGDYVTVTVRKVSKKGAEQIIRGQAE